MVSKDVLLTLIEREKKHCDSLIIGSAEYVESFGRLMQLESLLAELEKAEHEKNVAKKERIVNTILECLKIGSNIGLPLIGYVAIISAEKEITFTGALRDVTKCFLPKRMN